MIKFRCPNCNKKMGVPEDFAGKRVRCPACSQGALVPDLVAAGEPVVDLPQDDGIWTDDLLAPSQAAALPASQTHETSGAEMTCPACLATVSATADRCLQCGQALNAPTAVPPIGPTISRFALAVCGSCVGAALGGSVWAAIAYFTEYEVGIVAWGVGFLAGIGAAVLTEERSTRLMLTVGATAVLGLIIGKLMIFSWIAPSAFQQMIDSVGLEENAVARTMEDPERLFRVACLELADRGELDEELVGLVRETFDNEQLEGLPEEVIAGRETVLMALDEWTDAEKEAVAEAQAHKIFGAIGQAAANNISLVDRIKMSLSIWDGLWAFFAIGTACKIVAPTGESKH